MGVLTPSDLEAAGTRARRKVVSFPMRDADDTVIGLRLRCVDGKFAATGSRNGLFTPRGLPASSARLYIAEGESDAASLLDLGVDAVGRPGCGNSGDIVVEYCKRTRPSQVIVVADNDDQGRNGARELAFQLHVHCPRVVIITPPPAVKDFRLWKAVGATTDTVEKEIGSSAPIEFNISNDAHDEEA
jgi:hypothetical protein